MDGDAHDEGRQTQGLTLGVETRHRTLHGPGAAHRPLGVVGPLERGPEQDEDGVADELVDRPPVLEDHRRHRAQVAVEEPDHLFGTEPLGEPGEAAQVRHQDGDGPDLPPRRSAPHGGRTAPPAPG